MQSGGIFMPRKILETKLNKILDDLFNIKFSFFKFKKNQLIHAQHLLKFHNQRMGYNF